MRFFLPRCNHDVLQGGAWTIAKSKFWQQVLLGIRVQANDRSAGIQSE